MSVVRETVTPAVYRTQETSRRVSGMAAQMAVAGMILLRCVRAKAETDD